MWSIIIIIIIIRSSGQTPDLRIRIIFERLSIKIYNKWLMTFPLFYSLAVRYTPVKIRFTKHGFKLYKFNITFFFRIFDLFKL